MNKKNIQESTGHFKEHPRINRTFKDGNKSAHFFCWQTVFVFKVVNLVDRFWYSVARAMEGNTGNRVLFRLPSLDPPHAPNPSPVFWGILLIIAGVTTLALCVQTTIAKMFPPPEHPAADMMLSEWYYALLLPITVPVTVVAIYLHWLSMKLFKHA